MGEANHTTAHQRKPTQLFERVSLLCSGLPARSWVVFLLLALLATCIYSNTFSVPFQFDDEAYIVENAKIKHLRNFLDFSGTRYVGLLSFALNYSVGGLHVFGYHLVNLLIHITNGCLVYTLIRLLWKTSPVVRAMSPHSQLPTAVAFVTALLFTVHPIQTQAVTYIVQRFTSLATLFYLLCVVSYMKWKISALEGEKSHVGYGLAVLLALFAMKTKEIAFTLPFMLLLIEGVFFSVVSLPISGWAARRAQFIALLPFFLLLPVIPFSRPDLLIPAELLEQHKDLGFGTAAEAGASRLAYLFTQFRVIITYIRLLLFPFHQNLAYDYPSFHSLFEPQVFASFLFLFMLVNLALFLLYRSRIIISDRPDTASAYRLIAFGLLWCFLTLSVESSIIPIHDVIYEHRLYLPSVGFFLAASTATWSLAQRARDRGGGVLLTLSRPTSVVMVLAVVVLCLAIATHQRNKVWSSPMSLWTDVVEKAPHKPGAHLNVGIAYAQQGRLNEAVQAFQRALALKPTYADAYNNLGLVYQQQGQLEQAILEFRHALSLHTGSADAHNNLGVAYRQQGRLHEAIQEYRRAIRLQPDFAGVRYNLGNVYLSVNQAPQAIEELRYAIALDPGYAEAHASLGAAYQAQGDFQIALKEYRRALTLRPDLAHVHYNLGVLYQRQGETTEARKAFERALQIQPDLLLARQALNALTR